MFPLKAWLICLIAAIVPVALAIPLFRKRISWVVRHSCTDKNLGEILGPQGLGGGWMINLSPLY